MQNESTLKGLGFQINTSGQWFFRGKNQIFVAICDNVTPPTPYVKLYLASKEIDERPLSTNRGKHYKRYIKDCCSFGSVQKAIDKFDLPNCYLSETNIGLLIKPLTNILFT